MFNPSRDEVRQFFTDTWRKQRQGEILTPLEAIAADWIVEHPEYHTDLADTEAAQAQDYSPERGQTNPFLHLSMHLAITEQLSIDQPPGIRAAHERLAAPPRLDPRGAARDHGLPRRNHLGSAAHRHTAGHGRLFAAHRATRRRRSKP